MISFGLESLVYCPPDIAQYEWERIKKDLHGGNRLFIRGYGRDAAGTSLFFHLYKELFGNESITKDATNNANPTKCILEWTKLSKKTLTKKQIENKYNQIQNFQISHVFGKTKNPLLFTAPWNIIILPKIMDPFTGHEAKGKLNEEFSLELKSFIYKRFKTQIEDYNKLANNKLRDQINSIVEKMKKDGSFKNANLDKFLEDALSEWQEIKIY
jgi:hypothetical protein